MKLWEGRFTQKTDPQMEKFNRSLPFDKRFVEEDITGSIAYAKALKKLKIFTPAETTKVLKALKQLLKDKENLAFSENDEDIHTAIERLLVKKTGSAGKKLHTGRSRNDQVALDTRMYLKKEILNIREYIKELMTILLKIAKKEKDIIMPAFTHLQAAQPILFSHYLLSFFFMLERDITRLDNVYKTTDIMPLGSGALAGSGFNIDREFLAKELNFAKISNNSIEAVADRDYILEFLSTASILSAHMGRYAEDLIIFSSPGYAYIELSDAYSTGSSIMPNKKNPDSLELIRGKTGRVYGNLFTMFTALKGLPLTYNKDLQEDKEPLFDTIDTLKGCIEIFSGLLSTMDINRENIKNSLSGDLLATDIADCLVENNVPFRDAHSIVAKIVVWCKKNNKSLFDLSNKELRQHSKKIPESFKLSYKDSLNRRNLYGGTGPKSVAMQIKKAGAILKKI